ncbi:AAA ATPase midasin, partial [Bonamia ostreae]
MFNILRAMQLDKAILIEGSPGVGKTATISALAKLTKNKLVRINLSEHTDIMDLIGCDLPRGDKFCWEDGVFLKAMRNGDWVMLDELNLAPQQVLEGLNSVLDHRKCVFVPEIGENVSCADGFRVFATQNPLSEGGGRKGLPFSFLNR